MNLSTFILIGSGLSCVVTVGACVFLARTIASATGEPFLHKLKATLTELIRDEAKRDREALHGQLESGFSSIFVSLGEFRKAQTEQLTAFRKEATDGREALEAAQKRNLETFSETVTKRMGETNQAVKDLAERLEKAQGEMRKEQKQGLESVETKIKALTESNQKKLDEIRESLTSNLKELREENEKKLEEMRKTVDEKLHETLEKRIGESFKLVSERLEMVHKGLGEMQTLAQGVGDLKRVLTNVKSRGTWGEVQLGMLLDDMLTVDQYAKNVRIRQESSESVEYAVRLPGVVEGSPIYLPIDSKFPHEDYERLLSAQESGNPEEVERCAVGLVRAVRGQAKTICEKYVHPPYSTDFAIMYLPTEGLFAEIVRRPGLAAEIQSKHRVMITGPTTLTALLTSLQMGFRTLAIEKRSSEVWLVLGAAKAEFQRYAEVWDKLGRQLDTARKTVDEAGRRTRAVERRLRDVEVAEVVGEEPILLAAEAEEFTEEV